MALSRQIKPITYLKANAAEVLRTLAREKEPLYITQNGEARAVLQDIVSWEETQETLALLKILALGAREIEAGDHRPLEEVLADLRSDSRSDEPGE
jgi:prevent-host-death family protein